MIGKDELYQQSDEAFTVFFVVGAPTLARKLDSVHKSTVTRSRHIPRVLLAMPPRPYRSRSPFRIGDMDLVRMEEPIEAARLAASSEKLWSGAGADVS